MADYNYDSYTKCLERILDSVQKDYWAQYIEINRHQINVSRTYLWVSAALIGAYAAFYQKYEPLITTATGIVLTLAFICAVLAFGMSIYAMPARHGYASVHKEGWGEFSHAAYDLLNAKTENLYAAFLTDYISKFDVAVNLSYKTNQARAKLLRKTSWMLVASFVICIVGLSATIGWDYKKWTQKEKSHMAESNNSSTTNNTSTDRPNVPVPPPPAGSPGSQIQTHSEKPILTRLTESTESDNK